MAGSKFQPGTFLEIDDLSGRRKVVLVGRDGVTFWDSVHVEQGTPLLIHPVMKAVELGTVVSFAQSTGLNAVIGTVLEHLCSSRAGREKDSLFVMRVVWSLAAAPDREPIPSQATLERACQQAEEQERRAVELQGYAQRYYEGRS